MTAAPATQMDADFQYTVTVALDPAGITPANRAAVITAADETLGGSAFGSASVNLVIGEYEYSQAVFGQDSLAGDLDYWAEVERAVGPVIFSISGDPDGDGPQTRARSIQSSTAVDYAALDSIELDASALDSWGSPGVYATGTLPSAAAAALLNELTEMIPLMDYEDPDLAIGILLDWSADPEVAQWTVVSSSLPGDATNAAASADWPTMVAAASRIAIAGIRGSHIAYVNRQGLGGVVTVGACTGTLDAVIPSTDLFAALQTAGVPLPEGSAPGWCSAP